ncbi:MAG TPA: hypothetical protein VNO14_14705 [Blastocatellia bacterium]|nr:hypothetical protein [Blastocatellia bacterium]
MISVSELKEEIERLDDLIEAQKAAVTAQEGLLRELQQIRKLKADLLERISDKRATPGGQEALRSSGQ